LYESSSSLPIRQQIAGADSMGQDPSVTEPLFRRRLGWPCKCGFNYPTFEQGIRHSAPPAESAGATTAGSNVGAIGVGADARGENGKPASSRLIQKNWHPKAFHTIAAVQLYRAIGRSVGSKSTQHFVSGRITSKSETRGPDQMSIFVGSMALSS